VDFEHWHRARQWHSGAGFWLRLRDPRVSVVRSFSDRALSHLPLHLESHPVTYLRVGDNGGAIDAFEKCLDDEAGCAFGLALATLRAQGPAA